MNKRLDVRRNTVSQTVSFWPKKTSVLPVAWPQRETEEKLFLKSFLFSVLSTTVIPGLHAIKS